jgi:hypothetical protein
LLRLQLLLLLRRRPWLQLLCRLTLLLMMRLLLLLPCTLRLLQRCLLPSTCVVRWRGRQPSGAALCLPAGDNRRSTAPTWPNNMCALLLLQRWLGPIRSAWHRLSSLPRGGGGQRRAAFRPGGVLLPAPVVMEGLGMLLLALRDGRGLKFVHSRKVLRHKQKSLRAFHRYGQSSRLSNCLRSLYGPQQTQTQAHPVIVIHALQAHHRLAATGFRLTTLLTCMLRLAARCASCRQPPIP